MVRMNDGGESPPIAEIDDKNYFRLNIWGMGKARDVALVGAGLLTPFHLFSERESGGVKVSSMEEVMSHLNSKMKEIAKNLEETGAKDVSWLEPFSSNFNVATGEQCKQFAEALYKAKEMIEGSSVQPDYDFTYIWGFADWLNDSPNGVYVG